MPSVQGECLVSFDGFTSVGVIKQLCDFLHPTGFSQGNEGSELPGFSPGEYVSGKTVSTGKHKTSFTASTTACSVVLDAPLGSHKFSH